MHPEWSDLIQAVQTQTFAALADGTSTEFFSTLTFITKDKIEINALIADCTTSDEMLEAVEGLGYKCGKRKIIPEFVFYVAETISQNGEEQLMLSGCSKELEVLICYLSLDRDEDQRIRPGSWGKVRLVAKEKLERVATYRAMRGAITKANAPWWKF